MTKLILTIVTRICNYVICNSLTFLSFHTFHNIPLNLLASVAYKNGFLHLSKGYLTAAHAAHVLPLRQSILPEIFDAAANGEYAQGLPHLNSPILICAASAGHQHVLWPLPSSNTDTTQSNSILSLHTVLP